MIFDFLATFIVLDPPPTSTIRRHASISDNMRRTVFCSEISLKGGRLPTREMPLLLAPALNRPVDD
jgi:hypothetical protein